MTRVLAAAVKAAVTTELRDGSTLPGAGLPDTRAVALDFDEAQSMEESNSLPRIHVNITLTRRFGGNGRLPATKTVTGWRLTTTAVGTSVDEARWAAERVSLLEFRRFTAAGLDCSPLMFESADTPEPDDGSYAGATFWTFTTTPA